MADQFLSVPLTHSLCGGCDLDSLSALDLCGIANGRLKTIISGALLSGAMLCNVVALKYTTVAVAVFVMAAAPILAALLGRLFLGKRCARVWVSIVLAILGIGIMVGGRLQIGDTLGVAVHSGNRIFWHLCRQSPVGKNVDMTPAVFFGGAIEPRSVSQSASGRCRSRYSMDRGVWCTLLGVVQLGLGSVLFALAARRPVQLTLLRG